MNDDVKRMTTIDVETKTVDVTRNTKTSKDGKQYSNHWILNYENVTDEQLLSLATRGIVIDLQRQFRDATPAQRDELVEQVVDVSEFLAESKKRTPVDRKAAAIRTMRDMTDDEIRDALAGRDIAISDIRDALAKRAERAELANV